MNVDEKTTAFRLAASKAERGEDVSDEISAIQSACPELDATSLLDTILKNRAMVRERFGKPEWAGTP